MPWFIKKKRRENSRPNAYEKVQATRKKEAGVKKQPIIYSRTQEKIMFRVEIVIWGILFNQVKIDGMTERRKRGGMKKTTPLACRFGGDKYAQSRLAPRPLTTRPVTHRSLSLPVANNNVSIDQSRNGLSRIDLSIELALVRIDVPHFALPSFSVPSWSPPTYVLNWWNQFPFKENRNKAKAHSTVHDSLKFQFQANLFRNHDRTARRGAANIFEYDDCFMLNLIFINAWHAATERLKHWTWQHTSRDGNIKQASPCSRKMAKIREKFRCQFGQNAV